MTELELYKFVNDHGCEMHWVETELICFINFIYLDEFVDLADIDGLEGYDVTLLNGYIRIVLNDLCEMNDIDPKNIYSKDGND